jgi:hypothetical protein
MAYARLEPFGPEADDARMAQLLALIANVNRDPKKRRTPWTPDDFLPRRGPRAVPNPSSLRPRIDAAMAAFGGVKGPSQPGRVRPVGAHPPA